MLDTVKINHVQHISFTQSRLTDAVSVILSELLSYEHPSNGTGLFLCARMQAGNALFAEQKKGRRFYSGALSAKKGVSDTNQPGKRFQQPSIEQAHGDAVRVGHGVGGQRGQALYHNLAKERRYQGRQQRNKQAVHDAGNDGAAAAARSIGENGGSAAGKEI